MKNIIFNLLVLFIFFSLLFANNIFAISNDKITTFDESDFKCNKN